MHGESNGDRLDVPDALLELIADFASLEIVVEVD